jgi:spore germination cell wall hydrolase CwlJ-like protein
MSEYRTGPVARVERQLAALRGFGAAAFAILATLGFSASAEAPGTGLEVVAVASPAAMLSGQGTDLTITGSVGGLFANASFVGPNRADKQDRARGSEDIYALTQRFTDIRARIAALRMPKPIAPVVLTASVAPQAVASPVPVAAAIPAEAQEALAAANQLAGEGDGGAAPLPVTMSSKLAYARADLPPTTFDSTVTATPTAAVSDKQMWCMATAIYFEARGESYRGQVAVGQVVMNRVKHPLYPDTICAVVFQNQNMRNACQFSFACDGIPERVTDKKAWAQAMKIAQDVVGGTDYLPEVGKATHYHATYVYPHWAPRMKKVTKIGMHVFYQFKRGWNFG